MPGGCHADAASADPVAAIRKFTRFYTRRIGVLQEGLLGSSLSLTEARVVYEIATRPPLTASDLCTDLDLDAGLSQPYAEGTRDQRT